MYHVYDPTFYVQLIAFFLLDMAMVYFNFYVLIPRLLLPGKYFYYGLSLAIAILIAATLTMLLKQVYTHFGSKLFAVTADFTFANVAGAIIERFYLLGLTTAIKLAKDWIQSQQRIKAKGKTIPRNGTEFSEITDPASFFLQHVE